MYKSLVASALAVCMTMIQSAEAAAERRIALVIGNSSYAHVGALANPTADGRLIADTLTRIGFKTTMLLNAGQLDMKRAIAAFGRSLRMAGTDAVGVFYFAGHGIQAGGRNYLIPVEANPQDEADLDLVGVEANWVLRQMESARNVTNIVILDACRNNPLGSASRSASRGLARLEAPTGSYIAYATAPGEVAVDGDGANSPFSAALAETMLAPGLAIEQVFKQVRVKVLRATGGRQTPWDSSSLVHDFAFVDAPAAETTSVELSLWRSVSASGDPGQIALFLQTFPRSRFAPEAKRLLVAAAVAQAAPADGAPAPDLLASNNADRSASAPPQPATVEPEPAGSGQLEGAAPDDGFDQASYGAGQADAASVAPAGVDDDLEAAEAAEAALSLDRRQRREIQRRLLLLGFDTRGADGIFGRNTRRAISEWRQTLTGQTGAGYLTGSTLARLRKQSEKLYANWRRQNAHAAAGRQDRERRQQPSRSQGGCRRDGRGAILQGQSFNCDFKALREAL